jgi:hypothetical protein
MGFDLAHLPYGLIGPLSVSAFHEQEEQPSLGCPVWMK